MHVTLDHRSGTQNEHSPTRQTTPERQGSQAEVKEPAIASEEVQEGQTQQKGHR